MFLVEGWFQLIIWNLELWVKLLPWPLDWPLQFTIEHLQSIIAALAA